MRGYITQRGNNTMGKLSKAKNLTKTEKFCIQGMYYNEMNSEDISKALGRDISKVQSYVEELEEDGDKTFIINETGSGNRGVAVMTQAGSERVDAVRERTHSNPTTKHANTIHSIHE